MARDIFTISVNFTFIGNEYSCRGEQTQMEHMHGNFEFKRAMENALIEQLNSSAAGLVFRSATGLQTVRHNGIDITDFQTFVELTAEEVETLRIAYEASTGS